MEQPGARGDGARGRDLRTRARDPGTGGELPGLAPALQPEEEERHVAAGLRVSAGVRSTGTRPDAAGKTTGEEAGERGDGQSFTNP